MMLNIIFNISQLITFFVVCFLIRRLVHLEHSIILLTSHISMLEAVIRGQKQ